MRSGLNIHRFRVLDVLRGTALRNLWGALGLLVAGFIVTVLTSLYIKAGVDSAAQREFDSVCSEIRIHIDARLEAGAQILRSGVALFNVAQPMVSRDDWRTFFERLQIPQHLPGTQGIGFAALIPREQLDQHVQAIRGEGFPDYQIRPAGERKFYSAIIYLEPFNDQNRRAFGYDMLSEPVRRAAMERARDENTASLSGKVILVQETDQDVQAGVLLYAPVYHRERPIKTIEERRAALQGWVYSPYRMTDLMRGTLGHWDAEHKGKRIALQVYDGEVLSADTLLYDSRDAAGMATASPARMSRITPLNFAGHRWALRFTESDEETSWAEYSRVWLVLFGGTISTLLLFGMMLWRQQRIQFDRDKAEAEKALISSEERFRVAAENLTDVVYEWDIKKGRLDWYGDIDGITGYPSGEFPRTISAWAAMLHPQDNIRAMAALEAHVKGVAPYNVEYRIRKRSGESRWWSARGTALRDDQGEAYKMIGSITDITERKRAEERLRVQVAAMEATAEAILIANPNGIVTWVNQAFTALTGYTAADIIGRHTSILAPERKPDATFAEIQKALSVGKAWRGELVNRRKDGSLYSEEITITPVPDEGGAVTQHIAIKKDITERKRNEAALREQQKLASIGTLARGMAHEINNPIMGVMNYAQLIKDKAADDASLVGFADEIIAEILRVANMTHSLLGFAQQQDARPFAPVAGASVANVVLPLAGKAARARGIVLSSDIPPALPSVSCHKGQLGQVLKALLANAMEAFDEGTLYPASPEAVQGKGNKAIHLTIQEVGKAGRAWLRLTVEDNGPGIPNEIKERLFDPFFTTKDRTKHSGLGLWISRSIAQEHGGELTCESEAGHGARFHMDIPAAQGSG